MVSLRHCSALIQHNLNVNSLFPCYLSPLSQRYKCSGRITTIAFFHHLHTVISIYQRFERSRLLIEIYYNLFLHHAVVRQ
jgi:hypothetical protein